MDNINKTLMDNEEFLNEERNKKRDEKAKLVQEHFNKIGAATYDVFKYGWDACAKEYELILSESKEYKEIDAAIVINLEKENDELKRKFDIAKEALKFYTNAANWEYDIHPQLGPHVIMLNEKDTTLVDNKIVGGFIAKMALDDLEIAGK